MTQTEFNAMWKNGWKSQPIDNSVEKTGNEWINETKTDSRTNTIEARPETASVSTENDVDSHD